MFGTAGHLPELIIILVLGLIILGPGKLPQVGSALGKTIKEFRKSAQEPEDDAGTSAETTVPPVRTTSSTEEPTVVKVEQK